MSRELDEQCARAMGWEQVGINVQPFTPPKGSISNTSTPAWVDALGEPSGPILSFSFIVDLGASYFWRSPDGKQWYLKPSYPFGADQVLPHFSDNPEAARLLEDEMERRGLHRSYVSALWDIAGCDGNDEGENIWLDEWKLIRATPEQRCRAFLQAIESQEH